MAGVRAEEAAAEQSQQGFMSQAQEHADPQGPQMSEFLCEIKKKGNFNTKSYWIYFIKILR